ncbi:Gfo/Idh/MocA family protein [Falsihalocynthiibacter sp. SS001]|uniref:Gfo/Idh/MocA family protein n=1 Tax=Falsihalocynthiibacter sp. SS001 TaxID=3349698 RepID=UPI0036D37E7B
MGDFSKLGAAVIGTGFIGTVHTQALRRLGVQVHGVLGSSPERGAEQAAVMGVAHAYASLDELLADERVDAVHVTSPNHLHYAQVKAILAAKKHVICEKPLSMTSEQSKEMVALAKASGKVCAVCYNIRFYPLNQHAHGMVTSGELGDVRFVTGHYHQDWLAKPTDWNWRLETDEGGALRSVGDIGTHWLDLLSFITGQKIVSVFADLTTFIPEREKPKGPVATFSAAAGETEKREIKTDDAAMIMLRFANGAKGVMSTSQINIGRKNSLQWDVAGSKASAAWDSETPDHLYIGHRDGPNQILQRDASMMNAIGASAASLPGGHVEGFADSFFAFFRSVYADIAAGQPSDDATYASFEDGDYEMRVCDAVLKSAADKTWVDV